MDNTSEDFWVQYFDGSTWRTVATYAQPAIDFDNNAFYIATVHDPQRQLQLPDQRQAALHVRRQRQRGRRLHRPDHLPRPDRHAGGQRTGPGRQGRPAAQGVRGAQNYPNPFNPTTTIDFALPRSERVEIAVFDIRGARVATLASRVFEAGVHSVVWTAQGQASGVYFYKIQAGDFVSTKRMTLVK